MGIIFLKTRKIGVQNGGFEKNKCAAVKILSNSAGRDFQRGMYAGELQLVGVRMEKVGQDLGERESAADFN